MSVTNEEWSGAPLKKAKVSIYKHASDAGFTIEEIDAMVKIMTRTIDDYDELMDELIQQDMINETITREVGKLLKPHQKIDECVTLVEVKETIEKIRLKYTPDIEQMRSAIDKLKILKVMCS